MQFLNVLIILTLLNACVKDNGQIAPASAGDGTTGGSTTGGTPGSPDPLAEYAWHLENTGTNKAFSSSAGYAGEDIKVKAVHDSNIFGTGVRMAISDTGTDVEHSDLYDNSLSGESRNYTSQDPLRWPGASAYPSDGDAHGTGVAGLAAAVGWNGLGSRGIAPGAKFAPFRYLYTPGASETDASLLAKDIDQMDGNFDIFNYSYGYQGYYFVQDDSSVEETLAYGTSYLRNGKGAIYVQAAGNSFLDEYEICSNGTPACTVESVGNSNAHETLSYPYKVVVGAVNAMGVRSSYSTPGSSLWVSAPGGEFGVSTPAMITTDIRGCSGGYSYRNSAYPTRFNFGYHLLNPQCDYTSTFNGTSSATPVTSGVVALMLEANPDLTWRDVKYILAMTSDKIDFDYFDPILNALTHPDSVNLAGYVYDYKWIRNNAGVYFSNWYGFGRVNATNAVAAAQSYVPGSLGTFEQTVHPSTKAWYYDSGTISKTIPNESSSGMEDQIWVGHNYLIESVQIQMTTNHPYPGEIAVHLVSPQGTESRLFTINSKIYAASLPADTMMGSNAFFNEESVGFWKIRIYDGSNDNGTGILSNWKIKINGRRKPADLAKPYPVTRIVMAATGSSATASPTYSFTPSISSPVTRYEISVGTEGGATDVLTWTSVGTNNIGNATGLSLTSGSTYYLNVRAVTSGGNSTIQTKSWRAVY